MGPDIIHPKELKYLVEVLTLQWKCTLARICELSWLNREVPVHWRLANVTPVYKKGRKEKTGNCRPVSQTLVPGKVMEKIILTVISQHTGDH